MSERAGRGVSNQRQGVLLAFKLAALIQKVHERPQSTALRTFVEIIIGNRNPRTRSMSNAATMLVSNRVLVDVTFERVSYVLKILAVVAAAQIVVTV